MHFVISFFGGHSIKSDAGFAIFDIIVSLRLP